MKTVSLTEKGWMTPEQFGKYVGKRVGQKVSRSRIFQLFAETDEFPEGRVVGAIRFEMGTGSGILIPPDPQVLRASLRQRPGPITDYIEDWEDRNLHGGTSRKERREEAKVERAREEIMDEGLMALRIDEHVERLLAATVAGNNTSHGAENNLRKIQLVVEADPNNTYGMEDLLLGVTFDETYDAVSRHLGNPPDEEATPGRGRIDPIRTAEELLKAGGRIRAVAEAGGRIVLATGHPGALLMYYMELAAWVEGLGARLLTARPEGRYGLRGVPLDWAGPVGTLGNRASLMHTHDPAPMRDVLQEVGPVDLVVADHGFAGVAVAAGVPTVTVMDTNDPAFAVAVRRGADLTAVPMDDNRPLNSYAAALEVLKAGS